MNNEIVILLIVISSAVEEFNPSSVISSAVEKSKSKMTFC